MASFKFQNFNPTHLASSYKETLPGGAFQEYRFHALFWVAHEAYFAIGDPRKKWSAKRICRVVDYVDELISWYVEIVREAEAHVWRSYYAKEGGDPDATSRSDMPDVNWLCGALGLGGYSDEVEASEAYEIGDGFTVLPQKLFAALALRLVDKAITAARQDDPLGQADCLTYAIEAARCLGYAHEVAHKQWKVAWEKEKRQDRNKKAAERRHAKTYELREKACELYSRGKWPSVLQAAKSIHPDIAEYAKTLGRRLSQDRGVKTVYDWLRDFNKGTPSAS